MGKRASSIWGTFINCKQTYRVCGVLTNKCDEYAKVFCVNGDILVFTVVVSENVRLIPYAHSAVAFLLFLSEFFKYATSCVPSKTKSIVEAVVYFSMEGLSNNDI